MRALSRLWYNCKCLLGINSRLLWTTDRLSRRLSSGIIWSCIRFGFQNKKKIARAKKEAELKAKGIDFGKVNNEEDNLFDEGDDDVLFWAAIGRFPRFYTKIGSIHRGYSNVTARRKGKRNSTDDIIWWVQSLWKMFGKSLKIKIFVRSVIFSDISQWVCEIWLTNDTFRMKIFSSRLFPDIFHELCTHCPQSNNDWSFKM